jgi:hypothetical protein
MESFETVLQVTPRRRMRNTNVIIRCKRRDIRNIRPEPLTQDRYRHYEWHNCLVFQQGLDYIITTVSFCCAMHFEAAWLLLPGGIVVER